MQAINNSGLKLFGQCPNLYKEQYLEGTYVPPDKDFFHYGTIVDLLLTDPEALDKTFVVGTKKKEINPLEVQGEIAELQSEIEANREKAEKGNKTAMKGIASREAKIVELQNVLAEAENPDERTRVTPSMWEDAHETAEAIKSLDTYKRLEKAGMVTQLDLEDTEMKRRGTPDIVVGSPAIVTLLESYKQKLITSDALREAIDKLEAFQKWLYIWDIKTTVSLKDFDIDRVKTYMYHSQLAMYKSLLQSLTGITSITCGLIVGDKANGIKMSQDYVFTSETLAEGEALLQKLSIEFWEALEKNEWPSAKELHGENQQCFTCSKCRVRPFSTGGPAML